MGNIFESQRATLHNGTAAVTYFYEVKAVFKCSSTKIFKVADKGKANIIRVFELI